MTWSDSPERVLVDTHALLWSSEGRGFPGYQLSSRAIDALGNARKAVVSHASLWEVAIKMSLPGRRALRLSLTYKGWIDRITHEGGFVVLTLHESHLKQVATLPPHHGDPFDRLLVAQALVEGVPIVSADPLLDAYGVQRVW